MPGGSGMKGAAGTSAPAVAVPAVGAAAASASVGLRSEMGETSLTATVRACAGPACVVGETMAEKEVESPARCGGGAETSVPSRVVPVSACGGESRAGVTGSMPRQTSKPVIFSCCIS
jgi:hypothetical protein